MQLNNIKLNFQFLILYASWFSFLSILLLLIAAIDTIKYLCAYFGANCFLNEFDSFMQWMNNKYQLDLIIMGTGYE